MARLQAGIMDLRCQPLHRARAVDEDVDDSAGARLPARQSGGVKDTDKGADEVFRLRIGTQSAAVNSTLNQGEKRAVDETARTFDEAHGAARDGIHRRQNQSFVGHMVDEQKHPRAEGLERGSCGREAPAGCR